MNAAIQFRHCQDRLDALERQADAIRAESDRHWAAMTPEERDSARSYAPHTCPPVGTTPDLGAL